MKYKISKKRAEFLSDTFFEHSFKENVFDIKLLAEITEPIELDFIAKKHNYDDGNNLLLSIVNHPCCDISTAKMILHRADVEGYLKKGEGSGDYKLVHTIISHMNTGFYKHEKFYYDPKNDPETLTFDEEELKKFIKNDSVIFGKPKGKKCEISFSDNFHRRNLKFYDGTITIVSNSDGLCVKAANYNFIFKVPEEGFRKVEENTIKDFIACYTFPSGLKDLSGVSERQLRKVIIMPNLVIENDEILLVLFLFNSRALQLENALANVSTMMRNEFFYIQAFVEIVAVEADFEKIIRIKKNDVWFAVSKVMQVKINNVENLKFLKFILVEKGGILFSFLVISDQLEKLEEKLIKDLIHNCSFETPRM